MSSYNRPPGYGGSSDGSNQSAQGGGYGSGTGLGGRGLSAGWNAGTSNTPPASPPSTNTTVSYAADLTSLREDIKNLQQSVVTVINFTSRLHTELPKIVEEQLRKVTGSSVDQQRTVDGLHAELAKARADRDDFARMAEEAMRSADQKEQQAVENAQQAVEQARAEARLTVQKVRDEAQQTIQQVREEVTAETERLVKNPLQPLLLCIQERLEESLRQRSRQRLEAAMSERQPDVRELYERAERFIQQSQELKLALERVCGGALQTLEYQRVLNECKGIREKAKQLETAPAVPKLQLTAPPLEAASLVVDASGGPTLTLGAWAAGVEQQIALQVAEYRQAVEQAARACTLEPWPDEVRQARRRLLDSARNLHMLVFHALNQVSDSPEMQTLLEQANRIAGEVGITPVIPRGEKYDPYEHELSGAVSSPGHQKGRIVQVELPGYREGQKMLYKPRVIISE